MLNEASLEITDIVSKSLTQEKLSGLSEMLRLISNAVDAYGCILWQVAPGAHLDSNPPSGHLFVLAEWFPDNKIDVLHDLPLTESETGNAILSDRTRNVQRTKENERFFTDDPFLVDNNIEVFCSKPITFIDGVKGAVNLYRNNADPFNESEQAQIELLGSLIPSLYHAIRNKVSHILLSDIKKILQDEEEARPNDRAPDKARMKETFQEICKRIADSFQCIEASIYLQDDSEVPGTYELMATTWPWLEHFDKSPYKQSDAGLTAWVLNNAKHVRIFDLNYLEHDGDKIRTEYEGITWQDSQYITSDEGKSAIRRQLDLGNLPPFSFMSVPILKGKKVLGAIRCSVAVGPYYFSEREVDLLNLVAAQISQYWSNWLSKRRLEKENQSWRRLVESVGKLNDFVHQELTKDLPKENAIFAEALRVTDAVISGAEIMDIRLLDEPSGELYFAQTHGDAWNEGSPDEIRSRRNKRYPIHKDEFKSAGALVFETRQLYEIKDVRGDEYYSETFPNTTSMIIAPISVKEEAFGVLDIRGTKGSEFPEYVHNMVTLLGRQLGLYQYLAKTIRELRVTKGELSETLNELKKREAQEIQTMQDLAHQAKNPVNQAYKIADSLLKLYKDLDDEDRMKKKIFRIRGLCGKAKQVSYSLQVFTSLARGEAIALDEQIIGRGEIIKMLIEASQDSKLIHPRQNIDYHVDKESFEAHVGKKGLPRLKELVADKDLLEQAVSALLDNASKYSFPNKKMVITGGRTSSGGFHISFANQGIPIHADEVRYCVERGWQGENAKMVKAGGYGIGLFLADNIMKAHDGLLEIKPTGQDGITEVRLLFPVTRVR